MNRDTIGRLIADIFVGSVLCGGGLIIVLLASSLEDVKQELAAQTMGWQRSKSALYDRLDLLAEHSGLEYQAASAQPATYVPIGTNQKDIVTRYVRFFNKGEQWRTHE